MFTALLAASSLRWFLPMPPGPITATVSLSSRPPAGAAAGTARAGAGGVVAAEAVGPVGAADGHHRPAAGVRADDGVAGPALLPLLVPLAVVRVPPGGAGGEHLEVLGRAVLVRGEGQPALPGEFA